MEKFSFYLQARRTRSLYEYLDCYRCTIYKLLQIISLSCEFFSELWGGELHHRSDFKRSYLKLGCKILRLLYDFLGKILNNDLAPIDILTKHRISCGLVHIILFFFFCILTVDYRKVYLVSWMVDFVNNEVD